jgi:hypothetical protein
MKRQRSPDNTQPKDQADPQAKEQIAVRLKAALKAVNQRNRRRPWWQRLLGGP